MESIYIKISAKLNFNNLAGITNAPISTVCLIIAWNRKPVFLIYFSYLMAVVFLKPIKLTNGILICKLVVYFF